MTAVLSVLGCVLSLSVALPAAASASSSFPAEVDIDGRGSMDPNDRVATDAYHTGDAVPVRCQDTGAAVNGSTTWDYTTDGYWVPDTYVQTGTDGFVTGLPRCLALGIDGHANVGGLSGPYTAKADLDGRGSAVVSDRVRSDAYLEGNTLYLKCQDYGESYGGSTLWDYTADGYWLPDAFVTTGSDGRISGMPLCSSLGISGSTGANAGGGQQFLAKTTLNGYYGKSLSASKIDDKYADGSYLTLMCQAYGETNYGGSAIWDKTSDGLWVADYYVKTGSGGIVLSRCDSDGPSGGGGGRYLVKTTLNGYYGKSLSASKIDDKYAGGSYISIVCQAYGEFSYGGSAVWDKTSDGLWVADYYVHTGYSEIFLDRCDSDPKPSGGSGYPNAPGSPSPGSVSSDVVRQHIVDAATSQVGVHEWGDNCNPFGLTGTKCGDPWCSMFASWAWRQAGIDVYLPYSGDFYWWGKQHGTLRAKSDVRPGDLVLFGSGPGSSDHVGVVAYVYSDGRIVTVEGNWGNKVSVVGPYNPASPQPTHENIFAVVAPVADQFGPSVAVPTESTPMQLAGYTTSASTKCLHQRVRVKPFVDGQELGKIDYLFDACQGTDPARLWTCKVDATTPTAAAEFWGNYPDRADCQRPASGGTHGDGNTWSSAGFLGKFDVTFGLPLFASKLGGSLSSLSYHVPVYVQFNVTMAGNNSGTYDFTVDVVGYSPADRKLWLDFQRLSD